MASANIVIVQAGVAGAAGKSRDDLVVGQPVTLKNSDDNGVRSWRWALVSRPYGSSATLSNVVAAQPTFTPDVPGSYLIQLTVNEGREGERARVIGAVRNAAIFGISTRYPAGGEGSEANWLVDFADGAGPVTNTFGWWPDLNDWFRMISAAATAVSATDTLADVLVAGNVTGGTDLLVSDTDTIRPVNTGVPSLGSTTHRFNDGWLSGTIHAGRGALAGATIAFAHADADDLVIGDGSAANFGVTLYSGASNNTHLFYTDTAGTWLGALSYLNVPNALYFGSAGGYRMLLRSDGLHPNTDNFYDLGSLAGTPVAWKNVVARTSVYTPLLHSEDGTTTNPGVNLTIHAGAGGPSGGIGGSISVTSGAATATNLDSGSITISTPNGTGTAGNSGSITIQTGLGNTPGDINLIAGTATPASGNTPGGGVSITTGSGVSAGDGGHFTVTTGAGGLTGGEGGNITLVTGGGADPVGQVKVTAGVGDTSNSSGVDAEFGGATLTGGSSSPGLTLLRGTDNTGTGFGGDTIVRGGDATAAGSGTDGGGDLGLRPGQHRSAGTRGLLLLRSSGSSTSTADRTGDILITTQATDDPKSLFGVQGGTNTGTGTITITTGPVGGGTGAGVSGDLILSTGSTSATTGNAPGDVLITGGSYTAANNSTTGGHVTLTSGSGNATATGGAGNINLVGGHNTTTSTVTATTGVAGSINLTAGNMSGTGANAVGGGINLTAGNGLGTDAKGGPINLVAGNGGVQGAGGVVAIAAGIGGSSSGSGGNLTLDAGDAIGGNSAGGWAYLRAGDPAGTGAPGRVIILGADAVSGNTEGGLVSIAAGDSTGSAQGGRVELLGGEGLGGGDGGDVVLTGGGTGAGTGGNVELYGGTAGASGTAGSALLAGGSGSHITSSPGGAFVVGGAAFAGSGGAGGTAELRAGTGDGAGSGGDTKIVGGNGGATGSSGNILLQPGTFGGAGTAGVVLFDGIAAEFVESAAAPGPAITAGRGRAWVRSDSNASTFCFTDDTGAVRPISKMPPILLAAGHAYLPTGLTAATIAESGGEKQYVNYPDGASSTYAMWVCQVPETYNGGDLELVLWYSGSVGSAATSFTLWTSIEDITEFTSISNTNVTSKQLAAGSGITGAATPNTLYTYTETLTNANLDGVSPGDWMRVLIWRQPANADDDYTGSVYLLAAQLKEP